MDRSLSLQRKQAKANIDTHSITGKSKSTLKNQKKRKQNDVNPSVITAYVTASQAPNAQGLNNTADVILAADTTPADMIKTLDDIVPRTVTEADIIEGAQRYWGRVDQFHELYGIYPWEVTHTLHPKDRVEINSGPAQSNDTTQQEDPYVKKQRKLQIITGVQFTKKDIKTIETLVKEAKANGRVANDHEEFIALAEETGHVEQRDAATARFMLRYMDTQRIVGNSIETIYNQLDIASQVNLQQGVQAISRFLGEELHNNFIGNRINGLRDGGVYDTWTNLEQLRTYLSRAIGTYENAFEAAVESNKQGKKLRLIQILNANEWNIEKYIGLLQRAQFSQYNLAIPFEFLANVVYESSTSQGSIGGDGQLALQAALEALHEKYLKEHFTEQEIQDYDYSHTREHFRQWFLDNGYTYERIRQAVATERNYSDMADAQPITDEDIDNRLKDKDYDNPIIYFDNDPRSKKKEKDYTLK
ncbi:hypothetical protein BKI52_20245 [marine bacterium AO1-C]|nr:hypothetical protein BKI52_20245 [marine bacterium AO1-C]